MRPSFLFAIPKCVNHSFMLEVLKRFNFGTEFLKWVKIFYTDRKNYVINNGFLTDRISMQRGIFQGCPISPYLFLFVMEVASLAIKQNPSIKGIPVNDNNHDNNKDILISRRRHIFS